MELVKPGYKHLEFEKESLFLITGVAGFIGSNLLEAILNLGYNVRGMDNFSTGKKENIEAFLSHPNFEFIEGDICDLETCRKACRCFVCFESSSFGVCSPFYEISYFVYPK